MLLLKQFASSSYMASAYAPRYCSRIFMLLKLSTLLEKVMSPLDANILWLLLSDSNLARKVTFRIRIIINIMRPRKPFPYFRVKCCRMRARRYPTRLRAGNNFITERRVKVHIGNVPVSSRMSLEPLQ